MNTVIPVLADNIFQTIFEKSPGSLLVKADPQFTILAASDSYLKVTGSIREQIVGRGFFEVFPDDDDIDNDASARKVFTKVIHTGQKIDVPTYRFDIYNAELKRNQIHYWSCSNTPVFDDHNNVAYILNTIIDITSEVKAKEAAIESENRLRLAAEAAALGTWDLDLQTQAFICSPRVAEIFGHPADSKITLNSVRGQVNADDMQNIVLAAYNNALATGHYLYEVRINWPDGSLHWVKTQGMVLTDEQKKPVRMIGTIMDVTESKRDEIRKNDFIAMASHELKTPLTSLKAYIQLLAKKMAETDDSFANTALLKANNQVNKMTDLIHGFLDLSKLESGKLQVKLEHFDMNVLVEEMIAETLLVSGSHAINFVAAGKMTVKADKEKIGQVISNFLSNAIKYSEKGSSINICCQEINGNVQVGVTDQGIGIKPKEQAKLFQRFYRVENERLKNVSGFGIGLYLSSEIIQRHKGQIWLESAEDKGSTFYFSLPCA